MADFVHLTNLIQGEVIRILERTSPEDQQERLEELYSYLRGQCQSVLMAKLKASEEPSEP